MSTSSFNPIWNKALETPTDEEFARLLALTKKFPQVAFAVINKDCLNPNGFCIVLGRLNDFPVGEIVEIPNAVAIEKEKE